MEKWAYVGKLNTRGNGREQKMTGLPTLLLTLNALPPMILCSLVIEWWPQGTRENKENQGGKRLSEGCLQRNMGGCPEYILDS